MKYRYILFDDHYTNAFVMEAGKDTLHWLWEAFPDRYEAFDDSNLETIDEENFVIANLVDENWERLGKPKVIDMIFWNKSGGDPQYIQISGLDDEDEVELMNENNIQRVW